MKNAKASLLDNPLFRTKVKSANAKIFPEGGLGYFIGPTLALLSNSILAGYLNMYFTNVLNMNAWANTFLTVLPVISVVFVVLGNIVVGRLMDHMKTRAGKARPILLMAIPICILALLCLFVFSPYVDEASDEGTQMLALILLAVGYNLWFAVAYPFYYTPHAALVNLSTRNSRDRSLLATISNATTLAAMGLCSMVLPFFLGILFRYDMNPSAADAIPVLENGVLQYYTYADGSVIYDRGASYDAWRIFVIALMIINTVGILIEYYFTRERITEESFTRKEGAAEPEKKKAAPLLKQAGVCFKDKFWWIMIAFFFLYQLGGMMKNVSQLYFCQAMFPDASGNYSTQTGGTFQGTLSIIGAVPTALGMVIAWPLANKIGKGRAIMFGAILSVIGGAIGFIAPDNFGVVVTSFVVKALGSTPAMYLSLALLADTLDHQEAMHGFRTDGFTMTIYGAIMAGMTGIATGILNGVLGAVGYSATNVSSPLIRTVMPWIFIGGETICYAVIVILFIFMGVEKFSSLDHKAIVLDQKTLAAAEGREYVPPAVVMAREEAEAEAEADEQRRQALKARCEKQGLDFEAEERKYREAQEAKATAAEAKKQAAEAKKAAAEQAKADRIAAMSEEERKALEAREAEKAEKHARRQAEALTEFNALRERFGRAALTEEQAAEETAGA